jgi:diadenosine tetraphosphatase ApaH/serine/threonine PP2A family protein phosphatase
MRIAVMSDIHGNLEAFTQCLNDIKRLTIDRIVNLGDAIGYGPQPEEVLCLLEKRGIPNILGNHELAVIDKGFRSDFSPEAIKSQEQTLNYLTSASLLYIKNLPSYREIEGALMVHGCPPDSSTVYLNHLSLSEIRNAFVSSRFDMAFAGHTHRLMLIQYNGKGLEFDQLHEDIIQLKPGYRYIINAGAVGQPRDGDPRAKYVIWDNMRNTLEIRRVAYDVAHTAKIIRERGFVRRDAERLFSGDSVEQYQIYLRAASDR